MRLNHVEKVKTKISIESSKKTTNLLEGLYRSVYKGKSLDFDDLREYVIGDNSKDIDWKSSIRHGSLLVRRFIALKKHNVLFVVDNGIKMSASTDHDEIKKDVALLTLGVFGYVVNKNEDEIAFLYSKDKNINYIPFKSGINNLELSLTTIDKNMNNNNLNTINDLFKYILSNIKRKMIIVVITDIGGLNEIDENLIKKLSIASDLLFININDSYMNGNNIFDIDDNEYIPKSISKNNKLIEVEKKIRKEIISSKQKIFNKYKISLTSISKENEVVEKIINLLERHNHVIKR